MPLTEDDKIELKYLERCRRVAKLLNRQVYGGGAGTGFRTTKQEEIPHVVVELLDRPNTETDQVIQRLAEWINEKDYLPGHKTGELLKDALACINKMKISSEKEKAQNDSPSELELSVGQVEAIISCCGYSSKEQLMATVKALGQELINKIIRLGSMRKG